MSTQVTVPENVDATHSMILDDRRISAKKIASQTPSVYVPPLMPDIKYHTNTEPQTKL
jgi:hypothetical protein